MLVKSHFSDSLGRESEIKEVKKEENLIILPFEEKGINETRSLDRKKRTEASLSANAGTKKIRPNSLPKRTTPPKM
jgi:hypothetical protein